MSLPRPTGLKTPRSGRAQQQSTQTALNRVQGQSVRGTALSGLEVYTTDMHDILPATDLSKLTESSTFYHVGERVCVGGSKTGVIAYLGETEFAPGDWAGVVLDEPIGKNDGSVGGVRYFQCEQKRGVFSRPAKLSRMPVEPEQAELPLTDRLNFTPTAQANFSSPRASPAFGKTAAIRRVTNASPVINLSGNFGEGTDASIRRESTPQVTQPNGMNTVEALQISSVSDVGKQAVDTQDRTSSNLQLGERVLVSGNKVGVLRYLGETTFARGEWCGVELDDMLGKNDGSVQGIRYFECRPMYGLFAPAHKVVLLGSLTPGVSPQVTPSRPRARPMSRRRRTGSNESLSSVGSSVSTASRSRKSSAQTTPRSNANSALQEALREKEQHVDQLLKERDMERADMANATIRADEAEKNLAQQQQEHAQQISEMRQEIDCLNKKLQSLSIERNEFEQLLTEEKRKVEDIQFEMEEKAMLERENFEPNEDPSLTLTVELEKMETRYKEERDKAEKSHRELLTMTALYEKERARCKDVEESSVAYLDQVEELTHKLSVAEKQASKAQQVNGTCPSDQEKKDFVINDLKSQLEAKDKVVQSLETKIANMSDNKAEQTTGNDLSHTSRAELENILQANNIKLPEHDDKEESLTSQLKDLLIELSERRRENETLIESETSLKEQLASRALLSEKTTQQMSVLEEQLKAKDSELEALRMATHAGDEESKGIASEMEQRLQQMQCDQASAAEMHANELQVLETRLQDSLKENKDLATQIMESGSMSDKMAELESAKLQLAQFETKLVQSSTTIDEGQARLQETQEQLKEIQNNLVQANNELNETRSLLQVSEGHLAASHSQEEKLKQQLAAMEDNQQQNLENHSRKLQEMHQTQAGLQESLREAERRRNAAEAEREEIELQRFRLEEESVGLQAEQTTLLQENEQLELKIKELEESIAELEKEKAEFDNTRQKDLDDLDTVRTEYIQLQKTHEDVARNGLDLQNKLQQRDLQLGDLKREIEKARDGYGQLMNELKQANEATLEDQQQLDLLRKQLTSVETSVESGAARDRDLSEQRQRTQQLEARLAQLQPQLDSVLRLEADKMSLQEEVEALMEREDDLRREKAEEVRGVKSELELAQRCLADKDAELSKHKQQLAYLQGQSSLMSSYQTQLQTAAQEKQQLSDKLQQVQAALSVATAGSSQQQLVQQQLTAAAESKTTISRLETERTVLGQQLLQVNSTLAETKTENEQLRRQLSEQRLNANAINGNKPGLKPSGFSSNSAVSSTKPRLFCDICDKFDEHDTEDCPKQAMDNSGVTEDREFLTNKASFNAGSSA